METLILAILIFYHSAEKIDNPSIPAGPTGYIFKSVLLVISSPSRTAEYRLVDRYRTLETRSINTISCRSLRAHLSSFESRCRRATAPPAIGYLNYRFLSTRATRYDLKPDYSRFHRV